MDLYAQHILGHFRHPHGKERLQNPSVTHEEDNPACGDRLTIDLLMEKNSVRIGWDGMGCAISQAAMSMLAEEFSGKAITDLEVLTAKDVLGRLGVPVGPRRMKCALLSLHTIKNALRMHRHESPQGWAETLTLGDKGS